jgi:hypothetical protein
LEHALDLLKYNANIAIFKSLLILFLIGLSPPPATRRDVAGSDGLTNDRKSKPPTQQLLVQQQLPVRNNQKGKSKEDYDSRRSDSDDEQVRKTSI